MIWLNSRLRWVTSLIPWSGFDIMGDTSISKANSALENVSDDGTLFNHLPFHSSRFSESEMTNPTEVYSKHMKC